MLYLNDQQVAFLLGDAEENRRVLAQAFIDEYQAQAAQLTRQRIEAQGIKLSTLAAVIPNQGIAGAKVYTTIQGRFTFAIILFCTKTGAVLAVMDANEITKKRTAACSVLMAQCFANPNSTTLSVFGLGAQGTEHVLQFAQAYSFECIYLVSVTSNQEKAHRLSTELNTKVVEASPQLALEQADILITASRATQPIVKGQYLKEGVFVAAIGSSLPTTRELDDAVIQKASCIVVESKDQAYQEAGDLILTSHLNPMGKTQSIGEVLSKDKPVFLEKGLVLYKAVGVALEDIALAGLVYKKHIKK